MPSKVKVTKKFVTKNKFHTHVQFLKTDKFKRVRMKAETVYQSAPFWHFAQCQYKLQDSEQ